MKEHEIKIRLATEGDVGAASVTLADAFEAYPWTQWTVDSDCHAVRIRRVQAICLARIALPHGLVVVTDDCTAVAAFTPPGVSAMVEPQVWEEIAEISGTGFDNASVVDLPSALVEDSWELATVGVASEEQGRGLGSAVLEFGLRTLDRVSGRKTPIHLETSDARNVVLYERFGFSAHARTEIPGGPTVWSMQRM